MRRALTPPLAPRVSSGAVRLWVATRKGLFALRSDAHRRRWNLSGPQFLGQICHHAVLDPRDGRTVLLAARTGHLGPTVYRSTDGGRTWTEARRPPAFSPRLKRTVQQVFWLTPGHGSEPEVWYAGSSPQGLFRSSDGGQTWRGVEGFNAHPDYQKWIAGIASGTPDGPTLHSVRVDPRDARRLLVALSGGGVFESHDRGRTWQPLNRNCYVDFAPEHYPDYGQDPHCLGMHPAAPERLWQQNHCGIYRMDRDEAARPGEGTWNRVGDNMPRSVGDIGFPIVLHPRDPDRVWVFPMDGSGVWPRTSPGGKPAVYTTTDGGRKWRRQDRGFPVSQAWWTVKRQCMAEDNHERLGLYLGTTSGEVWTSTNEGGSWKCVARHLPEIYSIEHARRAPFAP